MMMIQIILSKTLHNKIRHEKANYLIYKLMKLKIKMFVIIFY